MTAAQKIASDPAHSVWLAAHAGTGKTKVLVDRVLRLLLAGVAPSSILCLTYTHAAAQEMQVRLRRELARCAMMDDITLQRELQALLQRPPLMEETALAQTLLCRLIDATDGVVVQTIHGFCQSLLARFPLEAGVAPHFALLDDRSSRELLHEAQLAMYRDAAEDPLLHQALHAVATQIGDDSFAKLMKAVVLHQGRFAGWFSQPEGLEAYQAALAAALAVELPDAPAPSEEWMRETVAVLSRGNDTMQKLAVKILRWVESDQSVADFEAYATGFLTDKLERRTERSFYTSVTRKSSSDLARMLDAEQERVYRLRHALLNQQLLEFNQQLAQIAHAVLAAYSRLKAAQGMIDYDDVIRYAHVLLRGEQMGAWVMEKLDHRIQHVLLDEAQDTSPLQWEILRLLIEELFQRDTYQADMRTLFVVGDRKQSIYRFQGAQPDAFEANREQYRGRLLADGQAFETPVLDASFRSVAAVLDVVDAVFSDDTVRNGVSDMPVSHQAFRSGQAGQVELWPLLVATPSPVLPPWEVDAPQYEPDDGSSLLAEHVSQTIAQWLKEGRELASKGRAVRAGDIMVLVRRRGALVRLLASKLKRLGVPVAGADRIRLGAHIVVKDIVALAEFCLLPHDDLTLACVLKTPWFGWSEDALFALAYGRGEQSLWQSLQADSQWMPACSLLADIRDASQCLSPHDWLVMLIDTLEGRKHCKRRFGDEVEELLDELLNQALLFEEMHAPNLQGFVHWLKAGDDDIKREMQQGKDAVRIMTVHGAKGLQAPVVILPDTASLPPNNEVLWWDESGEMPLAFAKPSGMKDTQKLAELKADEAAMMQQEYRRLLYVAMTRAEDELYVCGAAKKDEAREGCWYELVQRGMESMPALEHLDNGVRRVRCAQTAPLKEAEILPALHAVTALPAWAGFGAPAEPDSPALLRPSDVLEQEKREAPVGAGAAIAKARGTLTHQLLQWVPADVKVSREQLMRMAIHFMPPSPALPLGEVVDEVYRITQSAELMGYLGADGRAEVSLCGELGGRPVSGQIDRLVVRSDEVVIIDFKTNRTVPVAAQEAPAYYVRQLAIYRALLAPLYPERKMRCILLWTADASLMELTAAQLDSALLALGT